MESKNVFTSEEVKNLDQAQKSGMFHPFTCPNRGDGNHFDNGIDLGGLIPTVRGWICQCCDYTQDWAHPQMTKKFIDGLDKYFPPDLLKGIKDAE